MKKKSGDLSDLSGKANGETLIGASARTCGIRLSMLCVSHVASDAKCSA